MYSILSLVQHLYGCFNKWTYAMLLFSYSLRSSHTGIALINLCVALVSLSLSFTISTFVHTTDNVCVVFSAFFHYTILVSSLAIEIMALFMLYRPYTTAKKKIAYVIALLTNWSEWIVILSVCVSTLYSCFNAVLPAIVVIISLAPDYKNYINADL